MRTCAVVIVLIGAMGWAGAATEEQRGKAPFDSAKWIWFSGGSPAMFPVGTAYFRAEVDIPENPPVTLAEVTLTCDNLFVLYINGRPVGESATDNSAWREPKRWDLSSLIVPGRVVVAVEAINTLPGPAGLILEFTAELADGRRIVVGTNEQWKCQARPAPNWQQPDFDDQQWPAAAVIGPYGVQPWGRLTIPPAARPPDHPAGKVAEVLREVLREAKHRGRLEGVIEQRPGPDFPWPEAVVFVGEDCSLYRSPGREGTAYDSLNVTIFNPRNARAFPEHDLPAPMKVGHKLLVLSPAGPQTKARVLLDAARGAIGSPSVSWDGRWILVSMARQDERFFHIYRVPAAGGPPVRLSDGPFHDIDPVELPDGRIVFTSTRVGRFEEYHNAPSRSLFVMGPDGSQPRPLTHTIIFDNEPEVLADGRLIFIRSDNFFDRGKVETRLQAMRPDGTGGYTEFGLDNGPEYGNRLRAYICGSPAPMPDGRLAFLSAAGITVGWLGAPAGEMRQYAISAGDVAALPDGRLLCSVGTQEPREIVQGGTRKTIAELSYRKIAVFDPDADPPALTVIYSSESDLHSPVYLGPRPRPPRLAEKVAPPPANDLPSSDEPATGILFCQNVRFTRNTTAGWRHVRGVRVLAGRGLTTRSSHSYIVHAGSEVTELGTVPLAPDGSFAVEVPADTPIAFQAVDAEGRAELNEMSWIYVRPGERRGCVGCHQARQATPLLEGPLPLALRTDPLRLTGQGELLRFRGNNAAVTGLMELQFDRFREVAGINRHSSAAGPLATGADEVAALAAQLRGNDSPWRISAIGRLAAFRDPAAADALAEVLYAGQREQRVAAAMALAVCGTRDCIRPLLAALTDSDPLVAQAAAVALENLTAHAEPFDPFVAFPQRARQARRWQRWFAEHPWEEIERSLTTQLQSPDRDVVRRAAVALGHVGSPAAGAALRHYLAEHRQQNPYPEWQKTHAGDNARFNALSEANPRTLQAVTRSLGYLNDVQAVGLLADTLAEHDHPQTGNLFLAEACVEALGRIESTQAEEALVAAFARLDDYPQYTLWYGDHPALMACHASPLHYFIVEALDRRGATSARRILPDLIRALPIDPDRALLFCNDDYETLTGRVIRRHGAEDAVVETCLAILGDTLATCDAEFQKALSATHRCWAGHPGPEIRAAQVLSAVSRKADYTPRIFAAFERYRAKPVHIERVFDKGIPVVEELPVKHWVCFYLARALGNLADPRSAAGLIAALEQSPPEAAPGRPDPLGPGVLFLHNDLTPCWRAAVAWALGRIGDRRAVGVLLQIVGELDNAPDTRYAAAEALARIARPADAEPIRRLAEGYPEQSTRTALLEAAARCARGADAETPRLGLR